MPVFLRALCPLRNPSVKHVLEIFMKGLSVHSKQRGFTLIEVGIALAIGLLIIVGVANAIQASQDRAKVFALVNQIQAYRAAAVEWKLSNNDYDGIEVANALDNYGYDFGDGITIGVTDDKKEYTLTLPDLGDDVLDAVAEKVEDHFDQGDDKKELTSN